jgi:hypothetical protein
MERRERRNVAIPLISGHDGGDGLFGTLELAESTNEFYELT